MELQGPNASIPWVRMLRLDEVDAAAKLIAARKVGRFALHAKGRPLRDMSVFRARSHAPVDDNLSRRTMVAVGAVDGLLVVMRDADDETRVVCLQALCNLTASTPEAKAALMSNQRGIELILDLISPRPDERLPPRERPRQLRAAVAMCAKVRLHAVGLLYNLTNLNAGSTPEIHYALVCAGAMEPLVALTRSGNPRDSTAAEVAERVIGMLRVGYREPIVVEDKGCLASLSRCLTPPPGNL